MKTAGPGRNYRLVVLFILAVIFYLVFRVSTIFVQETNENYSNSLDILEEGDINSLQSEKFMTMLTETFSPITSKSVKRTIVTTTKKLIEPFANIFSKNKCMCEQNEPRFGKFAGINTTALEQYVQLHQQISKVKTSGNILIAHCVGGLGNCLNGIVTGLLIALLTNRAFYVEWNFPIESCYINWNLKNSVWAGVSDYTIHDYLDLCFQPNDITRLLENSDIETLRSHFSAEKILLRTNCPLYKHIALSSKLKSSLNKLGLLNPMGNFGTTSDLGEKNLADKLTPGFLVYGSILRTFFSLTDALFQNFLVSVFLFFYNIY